MKRFIGKKKKKSQDGTRVLQMNGDIVDIEEGEEKKKVFRKYSTNLDELSIVKMLKNNPHDNIVNILEVCEEDKNLYFEMEMVNIDYMDWVNNERKMRYIYKKLFDVKKHLQNLGIFYIDWKIDNFGFSDDYREPKLFDFDMSALYDIERKKISLFKGYLFNDAVKKLFSIFSIQEHGIDIKKIKQIDDYIFEKMFIELYEEYL